MSNDPPSERGVPDEVRDWLADFADEQGLSEVELLERLAERDGDASVGPPAGVADLAERVDALEAAVSDLDDALDDQIQDVRERVIQVKREADAKAPRDHDHPELGEQVRQVGEHLGALGNDFVDLDADVDRIDERVEGVDERMSRGFSNYEEVLEYLVEATDDLERKVSTVARTVVELRERTARLNAAEAGRAEADRLREAAQENGVEEAKCEECGGKVHLGLLSRPDCPHCAASFARLDANRGFFRSSVLRTGSRPALEGEVHPAGSDQPDPDLSAVVEDEVEPPPEFDTGSPSGSAAVTDADDDDAEGDAAATPAAEPAEDTDPGGPADLDVEELTGIGSAYAERLREAGVRTLGELALADADDLAEDTGVARGRLGKWIGRARERVGSERPPDT